jgi:hypothetical protein
MGQFGNQPDFITEIKFGGGSTSYGGSDTIDFTTFLNGSAIYVGDSTTGTDIKVIMTGVTAPLPAGGLPTAADAITIKGVQTGDKLPFIVDYVLATGTSASELIIGK